MLAEPLLVVARLGQALDGLGLRYLVAGSLASSVHGVPRATQDVDVVVDLRPEDAERLVRRLVGDFHVDLAAVVDAIARRASFNLLHVATMFKVDVFVMKTDARSREEMVRARSTKLEGPDGPLAIRVASPEDVLLHKLYWYRLGGEVSDRQWRDVLGLLRIQGGDLDQGYLDLWAGSMGVIDLLARAREQDGARNSPDRQPA